MKHLPEHLLFVSLPNPPSTVCIYLEQAYRWKESCMAQFSDGPVDWPWCVQLVHGAHSSRCSLWCPPAFPGTRINVTPLGGQKWERIPNSNCRKAHKSQGMTLDGQPSTTIATSNATTLKPLLPQADEALTWAALSPLSPPSLPAPFSSQAHTDPQSPTQAKAGESAALDSSSTSSQIELSSGAKKNKRVQYFPCGAERRKEQLIQERGV